MVPVFVPGCVRLTDSTVVLYSQGMLVYQCPHGFVLLEKLDQGTKSYMAEDRSINVGLLYSLAGRVQSPVERSHLLCTVRPGGKQGWEVCMGRPCSYLQCYLPQSPTDLLLERFDRIMILVSGKI